MRNKYVNRSRISEAKFREIVRFFSIDLTAIQIAELTGLNRNTVNRYLTEIRKKVAKHCELTSPLPKYNFSTTEDREQFFSILVKEYDSKIYTEIAPSKQITDNQKNNKNNSLLFSKFDLLIDLENGKHHVLGEKNGDQHQHRRKINRIESFWGNATSRLAKFKGMHSSTFRYHLKECEFRFNHRGEDLYSLLLKILRKDPLF